MEEFGADSLVRGNSMMHRSETCETETLLSAMSNIPQYRLRTLVFHS